MESFKSFIGNEVHCSKLQVVVMVMSDRALC